MSFVNAFLIAVPSVDNTSYSHQADSGEDQVNLDYPEKVWIQRFFEAKETEFMAGQPILPPPDVPPPRNKALLRAYYPLVLINKVLSNPYFWAVYVRCDEWVWPQTLLAGCWSEWGHAIKNTQIENNLCDWLIGCGMFSSLIPPQKPRRWGILRHKMFSDVGQP